ncbi:hypothetical protein AAGG74_14890 [Bacillus mexicanus]|uniref:hypothetical protein n=1 Tax=Bacillus mexicanus TaxID=2834415 RepID=UPI003D236FA2
MIIIPIFNLETQLEDALQYMCSDLEDSKLLKELDPSSEDYYHHSQIKYIPEILMRNYEKSLVADWMKYVLGVEDENKYGKVEISKKFKNIDELSFSFFQFISTIIHFALEEMGLDKDWLFENVKGVNYFFVGRKHKPVLFFLLDKEVEEKYDVLEHFVFCFRKYIEIEIKFFTEEDRVFESLFYQDISLSRARIDKILKKQKNAK